MKGFVFRTTRQSQAVLSRALWPSVLLFAIVVSIGWILTTGVVSTDSLIYLNISHVFFTENHAAANAEFPPLYPLTLKFIMAFGADPTSAARILNLSLELGSAIVVYKLLTLDSSFKQFYAALIALSVTTAYIVVRTHTDMLSESLFIFLVFCNFYWLLRYRHTNAVSALALAAFFASLAALSRYAGVAVIVSSVITAWIFTSNLTLYRLQKITIICAAASTLFALWLMRNYWLVSSFTGRQAGYLERDSLGFIHYADTISQLYFPTAVPLVFRLACFFGCVLFTLLTTAYVAKRASKTVFHAVLLTGFIALSLELSLITVTWFIDSSLPITLRILSPAYSIFLLMHFVALAYWVTTFKHIKGIKVVATLYVIIYILMNGSRIISISQQPRYDYNNPEWAESETIQFWNKPEHESTYLVSNAQFIVGYHLEREIHRIPFTFSFRTKKPLPEFKPKMHEMLCELGRNDGYLVYLSGKKREFIPSVAQLTTKHSMTITHEFSDGVALKVKPEFLANCS